MPDALDEKLAKALKQARKKPRNFALLGKGTTVLKLLVNKKPIKSSDVQGAKMEFKANQIVRGIVQGEGTRLIFKVDEEPTFKLTALREYLSEQTGMKLKPRFEVAGE